jgi:uncharacterized membrane protein YuzA (DUF378 family)
MGLKIKICCLLFFILSLKSTQGAVLVHRDSIPIQDSVEVSSYDDVVIDETMAADAYRRAKDFYEHAFMMSLFPRRSMGFFGFFKMLRKIMDNEDDIEIAMLYYYAVKDEVKMEELQYFAKRANGMLFIVALNILSPVLSIFTSLILLTSIFGGGGLLPIATLLMGISAIIMILVMDKIVFKIKKKMR